MEQIRIGICDDERSDRERMTEAIGRLLPELLQDQTPYTILSFESAEELLESCGEHSFSLIFSDIEMPGANGMALAVRIQELSPDTGFVFVSNHENYVFDAQEYEPLWFVRKEKLEKDLKRALQKYFLKHSWRWINFKIDDGFGKRNILLQGIMYFEGSGHDIRVVTGSEEYHTYGSLTKIEKELNACGFLRIHRNFLVNARQISHMIGGYLELTGGLRLPLGRSYKKDVMERMKENDWRREWMDWPGH